MARGKQTRRRKHKGGTQAGTVRPRGRGPRPRTRGAARATAEQRRQEKLHRAPTWRAAIQRGAIAAAALFGLMVLAFGTSPAAAIPLALFAAILYVPAFHMTDTMLYRRRMQKHERARQQETAE
jgi:fatty acid desaturase